jgi:hypothetical protein
LAFAIPRALWREIFPGNVGSVSKAKKIADLVLAELAATPHFGNAEAVMVQPADSNRVWNWCYPLRPAPDRVPAAIQCSIGEDQNHTLLLRSGRRWRRLIRHPRRGAAERLKVAAG